MQKKCQECGKDATDVWYDTDPMTQRTISIALCDEHHTLKMKELAKDFG